jgi:Zn-dependent peptidase ImmA (M78 family)
VKSRRLRKILRKILGIDGDAFYLDVKSETEADDFADCLLFADGSLAAAYSLHSGRIDQLAHYFGVTEKMITVALKKFGIRDDW